MREAFTGSPSNGPAGLPGGATEADRISKLKNAIDAIEQRINERATSATITSAELNQMQQQLNRLSNQMGLTAPARAPAATPTIRVRPAQQQAPVGPDFSALARQQDEALKVISSEFDLLKAEIGALKRQSKVPAKAPSKLPDDEIQRIASSLSALNQTGSEHGAMIDRLNEELRTLRSKVRSDMRKEMKSANALAERLEQLSSSVETLAVQSGNAIMPRVDDLSRQIDTMRVALEDLPQTLSITSMERRLSEIGEQIETVSAATNENNLEPLEKRLDEIARALVAVSNINTRGDNESVQRLEARIAKLDQNIAALAKQRADSLEAAQLSELGARIEGLTDKLGSFEKYAENGDIGAASQLFAGPDFSSLEEQLAALSARLDQTSSSNATNAQLSNLEAQIGLILRQINKGGDGAAVDFSPVEARLGQIEQKLDSSAQFSIEAAQQAAQQAVSMLGDNSQHGQALSALSSELSALRDLTDTGNQNARSLADVHTMLGAIIERLGDIEERVGSVSAPAAGLAMPRASQLDHAPAMAAQADLAVTAAHDVMESAGGYEFAAVRKEPEPETDHVPTMVAPSLDPSEVFENEHAPLEPQMDDEGGEPDLDRLVEEASVRLNEAKASYNSAKASFGSGADNIQSDPISAARRALRATRDEMSAAQGELNAEGEAATASAKAGLLSKLGGLNLRKPLIVAAAATLLIVAAAFGYKKFVVEGENVAATPVIEQSVAEPTSEPQNTSETAAPVNAAPVDEDQARLTEPETTAPAPAAVEAEPQEEESATVADAVTEENTAAITPSAPAPAAQPVAEQTAPEVAVEQPAPAATAEPQSQQVAIADPVAPQAEPQQPVIQYNDVPADAGPAPLIEAAKKGDPKALFELGMRYSDGKLVARDMVASARWFERSAEQGFAPAQYSVGSLYEKGIGVEKNVSTAAQWYAKAADQGNARAMHNLAVINAMGTGGQEPNMDVAVDFFHRAAQLGIKDSQFNLGILYVQGLGVAQDLIESYKWFAIAAKSGDGDAASKRDEVGKSLTAQDLAEAKKKAESWKADKPRDATNRVAVPDEWKGQNKSATNSIELLIKKAQVSLNERGFKVGEPDGLIGPKTKKAIMEFQRAAGIPITGDVDRPLLKALGIAG